MKALQSLGFLTFWIPLIISSLGGFLAYYLGIPGGWLLGAMFSTVGFVMTGREVVFPNLLRNALFVILGLMFGSAMTPEMLTSMAKWPSSMALVVLTMVALVFASVAYFRIIAKWDMASSLLASIPGALSHIMSVAGDTGANIKQVAISQSTRIFLLAALMPLMLGFEPQSAGIAARVPVSLPNIGLLIIASSAGALAFTLLRVPGALITGATVASALLFANGITTGAFQSWQQIPFYILLGMMVGSRMSGITFAEYRRHLIVSAGAFSIVFAVSALGAISASWLFDIPFGLALLAFAPGAFEAMAAFALVANFDPAFVIAHHMVRFFGIILMTPVFLMVLSRVTPKKTSKK